MSLLILSLYTLYCVPYCELMDTSSRTTSFLKGNSPKQSTTCPCKHSWRELLNSRMGFTHSSWVALGCPSQQRPGCPCSLGRSEGLLAPAQLLGRARGALPSGSQRLPRSQGRALTSAHTAGKKALLPFLLTVRLLEPCIPEKAQTW